MKVLWTVMYVLLGAGEGYRMNQNTTSKYNLTTIEMMSEEGPITCERVKRTIEESTECYRIE